MGIIPKNRSLRIVILVMLILALSGLAIAWMHYSGINRSADPRVKEARKMYGRFNIYASDNDQEKILVLLDSIQEIYEAVEHYRNSYEIGVVMNNRASVYLTRAIADTLIEEVKEHYFAMAERELRYGIDYYNNWIDAFGQLDKHEIEQLVYEDFMADPGIEADNRAEAYIRQRVKEIMMARAEMPRRLSVSYTNLGIIRRHENRPEEAVGYYAKALDLWDDNLAARNNLNIIFGRPVEKHGLLRKLFPPERSPNTNDNPPKTTL